MIDKPTRLPADSFADVVRNAPLVSVDFIVYDRRGRALLGRRNYEPAKGFYFVPGGRILKNERIADAFERIAREELGLDLRTEDARHVGVFEHFYPTSRFGETSTHYVVLAFEIEVDPASPLNADDQHEELSWFPIGGIAERPDVHEFTKAYFRKTSSEP